ncbi:MAG: hypothetical protein IJD62_01700, partial [Oscillospiraceae bacterium]|nr:hypothetical protein [Oscillospiraceae bacterium]
GKGAELLTVGNGLDRSEKQPIYCRAGVPQGYFFVLRTQGTRSRRFPGGHTGPPLRRFNKMHRILQKNLRQFCFDKNGFLNQQNRT